MSLPASVNAAWIDQPQLLHDWLEALPAQAIVGVDTEFMRRNTFYPQLALLQLGCEGRFALGDPLAMDLGDALQTSLGSDAVTTVMHSASEDLEALSPLLHDGPHTLFDTQIAAAFVGLGLGISYRALVIELAGVELDKGETRSDWLQRPLTASQRSYAALDVVYLQTIHEQLAARLHERGRSAWHAEDCARLKQRMTRRVGDPQPQRAMHGAADWSDTRQALLRRLLLWRDSTARSLDVPRPWLIDDTLALSLAHDPPANLAELEQRARGQRALRSAQRSALFMQCSAPVSDDELAATAPIIGHAHGAAKDALKAMKQRVDAIAQELDLPAGLLCPRKVLDELVVTKVWPHALEGWRDDILRAPLLKLLPG